MGRHPKPGRVIKSRDERKVQGVVVKEWMRTPKQLLGEYCQGQKRPRPLFKRAGCRIEGRFRCRVVLPDEKRNREKDITMVTQEDFATQEEAEHATALLALHKMDGARQYERKLPEPYRTAWLALSGREVTTDAKTDKKGKSKAEELPCEYCEKTFKKDFALATHVKREHAKEIAAAEAAAAAQEAEMAELAAALGGAGDDDEAGTGASAVSTSNSAKDVSDSIFNFGPDSKSDPKKLSSEDAPLRISAQGKFASNHERRIATEARMVDRRAKSRGHEQYKDSNPYTTVFMSDEHRAFVEGVVKRYAETLGQKKGKPGASKPSSQNAEMFNAIVKLGFREEDVSEALEVCGQDAPQDVLLDWLCIYSPEEYLPKGFDPRGKQMEVYTSKSKSALECSLELLLDAIDVEVPEASQGADLCPALFSVYTSFLKHHMDAKDSPADWPLSHADIPVSAEQREDWKMFREDELLALESLFEGGELTTESDLVLPEGNHTVDRHTIRLGEIEGVPGKSVLEILLVKSSDTFHEYPGQPAAVFFWNNDLNRHINAHMTLELSKAAHTLKESPQLYELWDIARNRIGQVLAKRPRFPFPVKQAWATQHPSAIAASDIFDAEVTDTPSSSNKKQNRRGKQDGRRTQRDNSEELLAEQIQKKKNNKQYQAMITARSKLPAYQQRYQVLDAVGEHQVALISGETGCGKTTQVPQFILDDHIDRGKGGQVNILCTQPRRLAAIGVAGRVSDERCEKPGETVGYQIRLENKTSAKTRLTFLTTGILLRRLQGDPNLTGVTHIVVDEVHERNVDTDFLLSILKSLLPRRPDLKLLLMSATMDALDFCDYFHTRCVIKIPGFVYPVKDYFLGDITKLINYNVYAEGPDPDSQYKALTAIERKTDYDLIADLVAYIHTKNAGSDGSILIFMSGGAEISRATSCIERKCGSGLQVLPLHGGLSGKDQSRVFQRPPKGVRKVVVSTNVAETSITIDDVVFVIDSGKMKETQYDPANRMSMLVETWVSRASARQRRGRAGRVREGECFKLYTQKRHDEYFSQAQLPEIHRVPLEQLVLQILSTNLGQPLDFMNTLMEPPPSFSVREAVRLLEDVGASETQDKLAVLTPLGQHLARLPMDVRIAKMLIYGSLLQCADQVLTIAAGLSVRNIFVSPPDKRDEANAAKKQLLGGERVDVTQSDHICLLYAYERWSSCVGERERRNFADRFFLHHQALTEIKNLRKDLRRTLEDIGFDGSSSAKHEGKLLSRESINLVKAALCAGLYPNVINVRKPNQKYSDTAGGAVALAPDAHQLRMLIQPPPEDPLLVKEASSTSAPKDSALAKLLEEAQERQNKPKNANYKGTSKLERVFLHPSSINFTQREYTNPWMVYREKVKTSKVFVRDSTVVPPYSLLMFGGKITVQHEDGTIAVDDWIKFRAQARIGVLCRELRRLLDRLLEKKIMDTTLDISNTDVLAGIKKLIVGAGFTIGA